MTKRTCTLPGCAKPHRARGLCSTHYNDEHQPERHRAVESPCAACGTPVFRSVRAHYRTTCSVECRTMLQHGAPASTGRYSWPQEAARRARNAGATTVHLIEAGEVYARDKWACYLCAGLIDPALPPFHPDSKTVDHVVPLSRGGQHTMDNVRAAHLRCNSAKGNALVAAA